MKSQRCLVKSKKWPRYCSVGWAGLVGCLVCWLAGPLGLGDGPNGPIDRLSHPAITRAPSCPRGARSHAPWSCVAWLRLPNQPSCKQS
jgi:hypothetical protein